MFSDTSAVQIQLDNFIPYEVFSEKLDKENNIQDKKQNSNCNKKAGVSSEVYAFKSKEEIDLIMNVLETNIKNAPDEDKRWIANRNKLLFVLGMNIGIRASDLRTLKFSFFFNNDGSFKDFYVLQPMKQRKQKKFVKLYFNTTVKSALNDYILKYPITNYNSYVFSSRKAEEPLEVSSLCRIVKNIALEAGIKQNIGSHSLRKSFGYWCWHNAEDKNKALIILQQIFNHSSTQVTSRYIGILDDEIEDMFNSIKLGFN